MSSIPPPAPVRRVSALTLDLKLHSMRTVNPLAQRAAGGVRDDITRGRVSAFEVMAVLRSIADHVDDAALAEDVVVELIKGRGGIASAMGNQLPAPTVHSLMTLLRCGLLNDVVDLLTKQKPSKPWWHRLCAG